MTTATKDRRLTITAIATGYRVETEYQNRLGYWTTLSTTITVGFPWIIVGRIAAREDFQIFVR